MATVEDDLDSFFAKKKSKSKRPKGIQNVDVLAKKLEQTVKQQEELDRDEEKMRQKEMEMQNTKNEDPEWLDPVVPDELDLDKLKIKEMDAIVQEVHVDEVQKEEPETHKTWNTALLEEVIAVEEPVDTESKTQTVGQKYVPRQRLLQQLNQSSAASPDVKNESEFPTLAAAAELETFIEKTKKRSAWGPVDKQRKPLDEASCEREETPKISEPKAPLSEKNSNPPSDTTTSQKYVPPWLRNKT